ncbi:AEC family transporter [Tessaracoccus flavus]|uniref:Uncharacterized protein n=1 Tax=Tessaracoccus flavus TaxID=1610493 RepID=A0A1Q2CCG8_9ACTN|nr:hypothetical protein [Tessaracoccus flavus]AQP43809.1 hypothetical protein RPIT_02395 [Tessaracoccus flavus]SDY24600.1 hypothetical protein SAMN05428934_10177 [Tessaracoccus flavus]
MGHIVASVLPIILLIGLGWLLRATRVLSDAGVDTLKTLVVNVVLPAVLFNAFLGIEFQAEYLAIIILVPLVCLALLALGYVAKRVLPSSSEVTPFLFTGFEFGMVGLALFTAAYGLENVPVAGMVGLGHEFFIWFVFVTLLRRATTGAVSAGEALRSFATSPVIIAIALGLLLNVTGVGGPLGETAVGGALLVATQYLAATIVPIILIVVGHGTRLGAAGVRQAAPLVAARFAVVLSLALLLNYVVIRQWLGLPPIVEAALFTLLILPPPYIVPIFLPKHRAADMTYANNVLSLHTVVSVAAFITYVALTG